MKRAYFMVDPALLVHLLGLPEDTIIFTSQNPYWERMEWGSNQLVFQVTHPDLKDVPEDRPPPRVDPVIERTPEGIRFKEWKY